MLVRAGLEVESVQATRARAENAGKLTGDTSVNWRLHFLGAGVFVPASGGRPKLGLRIKTIAAAADPTAFSIEIQHLVTCELDDSHDAELQQLAETVHGRAPTQADTAMLNRIVSGVLKELSQFVHPEHLRHISSIMELLGTQSDANVLRVLPEQLNQLAERIRLKKPAGAS